MNKKQILSDAVQRRFLSQIQRLWPVAKGSIAKVSKPCVRPNCPSCSRGERHPAFIFSFTEKGKRRCMHVSASMVPTLERSLLNGRRLEHLMYQMGPALLKHHRRQRKDS